LPLDLIIKSSSFKKSAKRCKNVYKDLQCNVGADRIIKSKEIRRLASLLRFKNKSCLFAKFIRDINWNFVFV
jgi:hypothetical protein